MKTRNDAFALPTGISFGVPELILIQSWAEFHDIRARIELDHCIDGDEYEEVIALYLKTSSSRQWLLWRSNADIVVQPLVGRSCRFASITDALESLLPSRPKIGVEDIKLPKGQVRRGKPDRAAADVRHQGSPQLPPI